MRVERDLDPGQELLDTLEPGDVVRIMGYFPDQDQLGRPGSPGWEGVRQSIVDMAGDHTRRISVERLFVYRDEADCLAPSAVRLMKGYLAPGASCRVIPEGRLAAEAVWLGAGEGTHELAIYGRKFVYRRVRNGGEMAPHGELLDRPEEVGLYTELFERCWVRPVRRWVTA